MSFNLFRSRPIDLRMLLSVWSVCAPDFFSVAKSFSMKTLFISSDFSAGLFTSDTLALVALDIVEEIGVNAFEDAECEGGANDDVATG